MAETANANAGETMPATSPAVSSSPPTVNEAAPTSQPTTGKASTKSAKAKEDGLGPMIRMRILQPTDLPAHPDLASQQTGGTQPALSAFLEEILTEGRNFMRSYLPAHFQLKGRNKASPPSTATVELLAHEIRGAELPSIDGGSAATENWFARTSVHENAAKAGTASWDEFDAGLRADHSQHEKDYTPNVFDAHEVLAWPVEAQLGSEADGWSDVKAYVVEMAHQMPGPLTDRVFKALVVTAKRPHEFLVVQIPVDTSNMPGEKYNKTAKKTTTGMYCSVEYCQLLEDGAKVQWQMGTASDAKGVLPMWAQKMGVPGAVVKDVGLFIGWAEKRRQAGKP